MRFAKGKAQNRIGSGIYAIPLAIRVHVRVEIHEPFSKGKRQASALQSVYMCELKFMGMAAFRSLGKACNPCTCAS